MKNLLVSTALIIACGGAALNAQTVRLTANIPFEFQTGTTLMPAGEYTFHRNGPVLTVRTEDGKHAVMVLISPASRRDVPANPLLQFERYGDAYFLSGMWTEDSNSGIAVPQTGAQKVLARSRLPETTTIALKRK